MGKHGLGVDLLLLLFISKLALGTQAASARQLTGLRSVVSAG